MPDFQDIISSVAAPVVAGVNLATRALSPVFDPVFSRLSGSGLANSRNPMQVMPRFFGSNSGDSWKVRISISPNAPILYNDPQGGILTPLTYTGGVVFPYTPQITTLHQAMYTNNRFTHSNYVHYSYDNSEIQQIQIAADFTAQTEDEARYVLACIYFFRAATKMFFGNGKYAGNPPPVVFLNGYGEHYFPNVPCVIASFSHTMPSEVDYIDAPVNITTAENRAVNLDNFVDPGGDVLGQEVINNSTQLRKTTFSKTKVPTTSQFQISLNPVYSKQSLTEFNLNDFAQGRLTQKRFI